MDYWLLVRILSMLKLDIWRIYIKASLSRITHKFFFNGYRAAKYDMLSTILLLLLFTQSYNFEQPVLHSQAIIIYQCW